MSIAQGRGRGATLAAPSGVFLGHSKSPSLAGPAATLAVTTDFRDVSAETLVRHMGSAANAEILPGFPYTAANAPGLFA